MADWLAGLGAGLQSLGGSGIDFFRQQQAEQRRREEQERADTLRKQELERLQRQQDQQFQQFAFQNSLTPFDTAEAPTRQVEGLARGFQSGGEAMRGLGGDGGMLGMGMVGAGLGSAGDALSQLAKGSREKLAKGRTFNYTDASGKTTKYYQPYERTEEGQKETERNRVIESNTEVARAAGVSPEEAAQMAKADPATFKEILKLRLDQAKQQLENKQYFTTLQRLGQVPQGVTFEEVANEPWKEHYALYKDERLQRLRNAGRTGTGSAAGTTGAPIADEQGNTWIRGKDGSLQPLVKPDGTPLKQAGQQGTEAELKAAGFAQRMITANETLKGLVDAKVDGTPSGFQSFLKAGGGLMPDSWAEGWANSIRNPEQQVYINAVSDFINAFLRRDSGAAISDTEWLRYSPMFMDRPGDSPEAKAQKSANRAAVTELMKRQAGRAWSPDIEQISREAAGAAVMPWSTRGLPSPSEALRNRKD